MTWDQPIELAPPRDQEIWDTNERVYAEWEKRVGKRGAKNSQRNNLLVLKLHGSLNWWYCAEHVYVDCSREDKDQIQYYETGRGPRCPQVPDFEHDMEPFFIPPSAQKFDNTGPGEHMKHLWARARQELHQAERIVFIGYSFPDLAVQFKMLVIQALKENTALEEIRIVTSKKLGAERVQFEERVRNVLGGLPQYSFVTIDDSGFEAWLKKN